MFSQNFKKSFNGNWTHEKWNSRMTVSVGYPGTQHSLIIFDASKQYYLMETLSHADSERIGGGGGSGGIGAYLIYIPQQNPTTFRPTS